LAYTYRLAKKEALDKNRWGREKKGRAMSLIFQKGEEGRGGKKGIREKSRRPGSR